MRYLFIAAIVFSFSTILYPANNKKYDKYVKEFREIILKKDVQKLIDHLSPDGIEMVATNNPEKWTKEKVAEYLNSSEPNEITNFFFTVLPDEFNAKKIDVNENSQKDGCELDSNLRGEGIQVYIKKKSDSWVITGFGYI